MNNDRRKQLRKLSEQIEELKGTLEIIMEDEEAYRDLVPENLQGSKLFQESEEDHNNMEEAFDSLGDATTYLAEI